MPFAYFVDLDNRNKKEVFRDTYKWQYFRRELFRRTSLQKIENSFATLATM